MNKLTAVVCDDDRTLLRIEEHILKKQGFAVTPAENGEEGVAAVRAQRPSLLILDWEMPLMDGPGVLAALESEAGRPYIIVVSSHEGAEKRALALSLGADEVVVKPFLPADFLKRIGELKEQGRI